MLYVSLAVDFADTSTKRFELTNELFYLLSAYLFMLFTDSGRIPQPQRQLLGYTLLIVIGLLLSFNFGIIIRTNIRKLCYTLYIKKLRRHREKVLQERSRAIEAIKCAIQLNATVNWA